MDEHKDVFLDFMDFLDMRQIDSADDIDIRELVIRFTLQNCGFGYIRSNLENAYGANIPRLFKSAVAVDEPNIEKCGAYFLLGTIYSSESRSHRGGTRLLNSMNKTKPLILFEQGFLASSHSWSHAFKNKDTRAACLGYVYDDISHYFMAEYPNRLIRRLNSDAELSESEHSRARRLIDRIVESRISKYNAQPFTKPVLAEDRARRVLVCDQAFADASTVYGLIDESGFERMLLDALTENPDAEVIVKSHPDTSWENGRRTGYYAHLRDSGRLRILREPINPFMLFDIVDKVYVGTSQMGLEALFVGKHVLCYGAPFYAGWGLTEDRRRVPHRHRTRTLEDIVHAFYIWYTIYHVPGCPVPSRPEDALDYIEAHRPFAPAPAASDLSPEPKVSVIIPVHGVERYVEACIASVQRQTLRDIEIIPVNDASPDNSQAIIDRLAADDPRIRPIILTENIGQGFARNRALDVARGKYVWFIDADDFLENNKHLAELVEAAETTGSDMVRGRKACEQVEDAEGAIRSRRADPSEAFFTEAVHTTTFVERPRILQSRHFWTWLYRRDFLDRNEIRFTTTQWEERPFLLKALLLARTLSLTLSTGAVYRVRSDSTARRATSRLDVERQLANFRQVTALLRDAGAFDKTSALRPHLCYTLTQYIHYIICGKPWQYVETHRDDSLRAEVLNTLRDVFDAADIEPFESDSSSVALSAKLRNAFAYPLLIAAVRAQSLDLVEAARQVRPLSQRELHERYASAPATPQEANLLAALNRYARNGQVVVSATPARARRDRSTLRVVFHPGATKTGSTYLQHFLESNRPALYRAGIWYPEKGLFWQTGRPHKQAGHAGFLQLIDHKNAELLNYISSALDDTNIGTIIVSSEAFFLNPRSHEILKLFEGSDIDVVVYIRRQDEWANSQYCEFVAGGAVRSTRKSIAEWLVDDETRRLLDYRNTLERFARAVGRDRVRVRLYDRGELVGGDIIEDFADAARLPILKSLPRPSTRQANDALLSAAHVQTMRIFNGRPHLNKERYFGFVEQVTQEVTAWRQSQGIPTAKPMLLTNRQRRELLDALAEANEDIARRWFNRPDGRLFDDRLPDDDVTREAIYDEEIMIFERAYWTWQNNSSQEEGGGKDSTLKPKNSETNRVSRDKNSVVSQSRESQKRPAGSIRGGGDGNWFPLHHRWSRGKRFRVLLKNAWLRRNTYIEQASGAGKQYAQSANHVVIPRRTRFLRTFGIALLCYSTRTSFAFEPDPA